MSDAPATMLHYFVVICGSFLWVQGAITLLATWLAPRLLERRLFQGRMLGHFPRTRTNLTLVSCWALAFASFGLLSVLDANQTLTIWTGVASVVLMIPAVRLLMRKPPAAASKE